jgi:predicted RNase H-like HicB family nuclease
MKTAAEPKNLRLSVSIVVQPDGDGFYAYCPGLKGIHVDGSTEEEAVELAVEAAQCYIDSVISHNEALPIGSDFSSGDDVRPTLLQSGVRARQIEVRWPSLQACGVS